METLGGFPFVALEYDQRGEPASTALDALQRHVQSAGTTDLLMIAHGFRSSAAEAKSLYARFLRQFSAHITRTELAAVLGSRTYAVAGVFWPSKAFSEGHGRRDGEAQRFHDPGAVASEHILEQAREHARTELTAFRNDLEHAKQRDTVDRALALLDQLEESTDAQDAFVALLLSLVGTVDDADPAEGFSQVAAQRGSVLLAKLATPIRLPTAPRRVDGGVTALDRDRTGDTASGDGKSLFIGGALRSIVGRVGLVLNLTTWYRMKNRSGSVGAIGVADAVRALKARHPALRLHLIGHSLGGRCMTACARSLGTEPLVRIDSLSLLQAAFSHYGLSRDNGHGDRGFFRDVIDLDIVRGPFISTHSYQDTVVGTAYAISSRLAGDNVKAVGDKDDQFGGIGRNGTQRTNESTTQPLGAVGTRYRFSPRGVTNLDGSGGRITSHSDVTNAEVTYAFACAVAET